MTNHSLRRTFCEILYESGESPAYVMDQMGHTDASLALEVYAKVISNRKRDSGARRDELVRGADWAATGSNGAEAVDPTSVLATENLAGAGLF